MNNQYNGYGNNYPNGNNRGMNYNQQQQMMQQNQQMMNPNMMNQESDEIEGEEYYSMGFNTTPPQRNRGGGVLSFLLALILVCGLVVFLLDYTGKIDAKSLYHKVVNKFNKKENNKEEETKEESNEEKNEENKESPLKNEVILMCEGVDDNGNSNVNEVERISTASFNPDSDIEEIWNVFKGSKYCQSNYCYIFEDNDSHIFHEYNCSKKEYRSATIEEEFKETNDALVDAELSLACESLTSEGSYKNEASETDPVCENYICKVTIKEKEYTKNCKE